MNRGLPCHGCLVGSVRIGHNKNRIQKTRLRWRFSDLDMFERGAGNWLRNWHEALELVWKPSGFRFWRLRISAVETFPWSSEAYRTFLILSDYCQKIYSTRNSKNRKLRDTSRSLDLIKTVSPTPHGGPAYSSVDWQPIERRREASAWEASAERARERVGWSSVVNTLQQQHVPSPLTPSSYAYSYSSRGGEGRRQTPCCRCTSRGSRQAERSRRVSCLRKQAPFRVAAAARRHERHGAERVNTTGGGRGDEWLGRERGSGRGGETRTVNSCDNRYESVWLW